MSYFILALSTLVGTIVGAGVFGLPYVTSRSGIIPAVFYFVLLGGAVMLLHLCMGEIALRTKEKHRLIGYARMYLGNKGKAIAIFSTLFGITGALLAYIILGGEFLAVILSPLLSLEGVWASLVFWLMVAPFVVFGIQLIAKAEAWMNVALFLVIGMVFLFAAPHVKLDNFSLGTADVEGLFLPFGVIFFALAGWSAIPEVAELFKKRTERRNLDNVIVWTTLITVSFYIVFSFFVVGVSGRATSEDALSGLKTFLGEKIVALGALFGLLAVATSFLILGNYLKNSLYRDFRMPLPVALAIALFVPLALFLVGLRRFIEVVGIVGAIMGAVEGVLILLIFQGAKTRGNREPEYKLPFPKVFQYALMFILALGAFAAIVL